jgi:hypothetical protein
VPNQELTATLSQSVTYRDFCSMLEGDSIAESGNNASGFMVNVREVILKQCEARMGTVPRSIWNSSLSLQCSECFPRREAAPAAEEPPLDGVLGPAQRLD